VVEFEKRSVCSLASVEKEQIEISVVSPVYMAENLLAELVERISKTLNSMSVSYQIILVEDRGADNSWEKIKELSEEYPFLKAYRLSRNFGQHYAITAGLSKATGKWVVVMDCDLQDRPEEIPALYEKTKEGFESVVARRAVRQDGFAKRMSSKLFYSIFSYLTETEQDSSVANFGIYHTKVIHAILAMGDQIRYFPTMSQWVGFNRTYLNVKHQPRPEGESSYSFGKLLELAFDNILAFSDRLLRLTVKLGFWIAFISMSIGIFYLYQYFFTDEIEVLGFASLIVSISFFSGMIILILGILGLYLGKTFEQVKSRPQFLISESLEQ